MSGSTTFETLHDLLNDFTFAMLVSERYEDGGLNGRPMTLVDVDDDGEITFLTRVDTQKVDEVLRRPQVEVTFQSGMRFASIGGIARVERDEDALEAIWKPSYDTWIPEGPSDPRAAFIRVKPQHGQFWDYGAKNFFELAIDKAKAFFTDDEVDVTNRTHGTVDFDARSVS